MNHLIAPSFVLLFYTRPFQSLIRLFFIGLIVPLSRCCTLCPSNTTISSYSPLLALAGRDERCPMRKWRLWKETVCPTGQASKWKSPGPFLRCCVDCFLLRDQWDRGWKISFQGIAWVWGCRTLVPPGRSRRWTRQGVVSGWVWEEVTRRSRIWLLGCLGIQEGSKGLWIGGEDQKLDLGNAPGKEVVT